MGAILHILVVDDRPDSVLFLTEFLLSRRHRVETCGNGTEALEAIVRRHRTADAYDLLISDVAMPGMDGLTLLKEIRRRHLLLPVALYTAFGSMHPNLSHQAQQHGCLAVLDKPIELRRVESLLDEVVARRAGTARQGTARHGTARHQTGQSEKDQPFFGTSRVARSSTTTTHRRETSQPVDLDAPQSGGYALEPKQVIPLPPSLPLVPDAGPGPQPTPPRIPAPIRTPLPFPLEQQEPQTRSMPSFRTPLPQDKRDGTGRTVNPAFRTPLPFLQQGAPVAPPTTPAIPPSVASAPPVRTTPKPELPIQPGNEETNAPPQPISGRHTTSFVRRGVNPLSQTPETRSAYARRPSGLFLQNNPPAAGGEEAPINPIGTSRIRRTVTGSYMPSPVGAGQNPQNRPPVSAGGATRAVACAHCRKVFMVASRPIAYTAMCVHCGQVNRIDPL
jgi:CheY-like chemotaxis protein